MRISKTWIRSIWIPIIAVFLGLLVGAIIMLLSGFNPIQDVNLDGLWLCHRELGRLL